VQENVSEQLVTHDVQHLATQDVSSKEREASSIPTTLIINKDNSLVAENTNFIDDYFLPVKKVATGSRPSSSSLGYLPVFDNLKRLDDNHHIGQKSSLFC
jgi:hypothetical protein